MAAAFLSRPVYPGLALVPQARRHIFALEGAGAGALTDLAPDAGALTRSDILYLPRDPDGAAQAVALAALGAASLWQAPDLAALLSRLAGLLDGARMGTRLYAAGSEGFIGQVLVVAEAAGIDPLSVATEHRGNRARRVQCVHCKTVAEEVTTQPCACPGCGLTLFVRDHYSRRLGAFQGVCIDAEEPGSAPAAEEAFR
ncbi:dimethylamine monooxygenase subunit DmmA family protein [Frigidibacter oleivorans]|uniref:dimethylamine monooxygenase subunit DmmA family protein n=1 Tax=Frigidibacter oleivorans TaxID=2487129 RepID=UPI000F8CC478|nr:dimethylamine monooxygenase subunit DmmA family protein [Frigidibacter oleivorans]